MWQRVNAGTRRLQRFSKFHRFTDWCSGAFLQLLRNQNFNRLSCRCTPVTSGNDGASCGFVVFRCGARKWADQSMQTRLSVPLRVSTTFLPIPVDQISLTRSCEWAATELDNTDPERGSANKPSCHSTMSAPNGCLITPCL